MPYRVFTFDGAVRCPVAKEITDNWATISSLIQKLHDFSESPMVGEMQAIPITLLYQNCLHDGTPEPCVILKPPIDFGKLTKKHFRITARLPIREPIPKDITDIYEQLKSAVAILQKYNEKINVGKREEENTIKFEYYTYRGDEGKSDDRPKPIGDLSVLKRTSKWPMS